MILKQITRKNLQLVCIAFFSFSVFISCSKDDDGSKNQASFTAMVDGVPFSAKNANAGYSFGTIINAMDGKGNSFSFVIWSTGEGTYTLSDSMEDDNMATFINTAAGKDYSTADNGGSGELVITKFDTAKGHLSGTFHFTAIHEKHDANGNLVATESIEVTNGVFTDIKLQIGG